MQVAPGSGGRAGFPKPRDEPLPRHLPLAVGQPSRGVQVIGVDGIQPPVDLRGDRQQPAGRGQVDHFRAVLLPLRCRTVTASLVLVAAQRLGSILITVERVLDAQVCDAGARIGLEDALADAVVGVAHGPGAACTVRDELADVALRTVCQVVGGVVVGGAGDGARGVVAVGDGGYGGSALRSAHVRQPVGAGGDGVGAGDQVATITRHSAGKATKTETKSASIT